MYMIMDHVLGQDIYVIHQTGILRALGTNQIAVFLEYHLLMNWEKNKTRYLPSYYNYYYFFVFFVFVFCAMRLSQGP